MEAGKIDIKGIVEQIIDDRKQCGIRITKTDIANQLGISRQNLVNKFTRDTFTPEELSKISQILGCELIIRDGEKEYKLRY